MHVVHAGVHWNTLHGHASLSTVIVDLLLWHSMTSLSQTGHFTHLLQLGHACHVSWWSCIMHHNHLWLLGTDHLSLALEGLGLCSSDLLWALTLIIRSSILDNESIWLCSDSIFTLTPTAPQIGDNHSYTNTAAYDGTNAHYYTGDDRGSSRFTVTIRSARLVVLAVIVG